MKNCSSQTSVKSRGGGKTSGVSTWETIPVSGSVSVSHLLFVYFNKAAENDEQVNLVNIPPVETINTGMPSLPLSSTNES